MLVSEASQLLEIFYVFTNLVNFIVILVAKHDVNVHIILNNFRLEPSNAIWLFLGVTIWVIFFFGKFVLFLNDLIDVIFQTFYYLAHLVFWEVASSYYFILRVQAAQKFVSVWSHIEDSYFAGTHILVTVFLALDSLIALFLDHQEMVIINAFVDIF